MYNILDLENLLLAKESFVALEGDKICKQVKLGNFTLPTQNISNFQTVKYLLEKGAFECVTKLLVDKVQDLPSIQVVEPILPSSGDLPEFTDPSLTASSSTLDPWQQKSFYHVEAGDVINLNALVTFDAGEITEPWNNDAKQADRSGPITSAILRKSFAGTSLVNGGTAFKVNDTINLNVTGGFTIEELNFADYEVDYGIQQWDVIITTADGPIPKDSNGNNLPNLQLKGTTFARTLWFNSLMYGSTKLYYGNNIADKETGTFSNSVFIGNSPAANYFNLDFTPENNDGRITIEIPELHITEYGTPKFIDQTLQTDISSDFTVVSSNVSKVVNSGATVIYRRYQTTGTLLSTNKTITIAF